MSDVEIDIGLARSMFSLSPESGHLVRRVPAGGRDGKKFKAGAIVGHVSKDTGYRLVHFNGKLHRAHRIVWALFHDAQPPSVIDHANGCRDDNRPANLRAADQTLNLANARIRSDNTTSVKGVYQHKTNGRFYAYGKCRGKRVALGGYASLDEASSAYKEWATSAFGEYARLNNGTNPI